MSVSKEQILQALSKVKDPELGKDIVSLGFVREISILGKEVYIRLVLTTPACPARNQLLSDANARVAAIPGVEKVHIDLPAEVSSSSPVGRSGISQIKNVIAVASGKGGVGKSTVAVNLAVALGKMGAKVGILDADIYGASIPAMLGASGLPGVHDNKITPLVAQGVEVVSMGFFSSTQTPVIWRGPLIGKAVKDFLELVEWSPLDYLIVDLPPGCLPAGTMVISRQQRASSNREGKGRRVCSQLRWLAPGAAESCGGPSRRYAGGLRVEDTQPHNRCFCEPPVHEVPLVRQIRLATA